MKFIEALESIKYEDVEELDTKDGPNREFYHNVRYWDIARITYPGLEGEFNTSDGDIWFIQQGMARLPLSDYLFRNDWYVVKR